MGVIECHRKNCDNIMCDRRGEHGNICYECFDELVKTGPTTDVEQFMKTPPQKTNEEAARARYEVEFPLR